MSIVDLSGRAVRRPRRLSSVGQSDALVMRRSSVRFRQAAPREVPGQPWVSGSAALCGLGRRGAMRGDPGFCIFTYQVPDFSESVFDGLTLIVVWRLHGVCRPEADSGRKGHREPL